jgi:hypothetical protein
MIECSELEDWLEWKKSTHDQNGIQARDLNVRTAWDRARLRMQVYPGYSLGHSYR